MKRVEVMVGWEALKSAYCGNNAGSSGMETDSVVVALAGRLEGRLEGRAGDVPFLTPADLLWDDDRVRSLLCVSKCCFMLSARVNFFWQPGWTQPTAFSAVWILECRDA